MLRVDLWPPRGHTHMGGTHRDIPQSLTCLSAGSFPHQKIKSKNEFKKIALVNYKVALKRKRKDEEEESGPRGSSPGVSNCVSCYLSI